MRLYAGTSEQFVEDTELNRIAGKLEDSFFRTYRFKPSPGEVQSWHNSLGRMADVLRIGKLNDHGVVLEYQLPLTSSRLDFLVCGTSASGSAHAAIVELKQWSGTRSTEGDRLVSTILGGAWTDTLHPSAQVRQYQRYLLDAHTAFYEGPEPIALSSCAFLHNYVPTANDSLFDSRFTDLMHESPIFCRDDVPSLARFLTANLAGGRGAEVLRRVEQSKYRPSKKLLDHVKQVIKREPAYSLLDDQLVVYDRVMALARRSYRDASKSVVIVRGGPGTGKSVIAMNLLANLAGEGLNAQYATGSRAFNQTLRRIVGSRASSQFKYFNGYVQAEPNVVDVLICDEAHRIRETSNNRFTKRDARSGRPQIEELMTAAKTVVFFIDDEQGVRPNEIGSSKYIVAEAARLDARVYEHELEAQFRCAGSDGFVNWITNTLEIAKTANTLWSGDPNFEFQIVESPDELDARIRAKVELGYSARLTAGFCWPWSDPRPDGTLENDVQLGSFVRPWNAKSEPRKKLAPGIPQETLWAYDSRGIDQVGCVYTAQGFEFDYIGVIFGNDLRYESARGGWVGLPENSRDSSVVRARGEFASLVKRTYRVLLSRGHKGCYVYFVDKETERFFKSRLDTEIRHAQAPRKPILVPKLPPEEELAAPFRIVPLGEVRPFLNAVPLLELEAAAGAFGSDQAAVIEVEDVPNWVDVGDAFRPRPGMFVARVVGESMNRRIPSGAWCLFLANPSGTRQGKVVLAELEDRLDPDTGRFTVKLYKSQRRYLRDGTWEHVAVTLAPDSTDGSFEPLVFDQASARELRIVAELIAVLT